MGKRWTIKWTLIGVFLVLVGRRTAMGFQYGPRVQNPSRGNFVGLFSNIFQQHVSQLIQPFEEFGHWGPYQRPAQQSDFERHFYNFEAQGYDVCSGEESEYSSQDCQYPEYTDQGADCSDDEYGIRWKGSPIDQANVEIEEIIARNFQGFNGEEAGNDEEVGMNFKGLTKVEIHNCIPQEPEGRNTGSGVESKAPENEYVVLVIKKEHILGDARKFNKTSIDAYIGGSEDLFRATSTSTQKSTTDSTTSTTRLPPMKPTKIPATSTEAPFSTVTLSADGPVEERAFNSPQQKPHSKGTPTSSTSTPKIGKDETDSQTTEGPTKFSLPFEGLNSDDANVKSNGTPTQSSTTTHVPATEPPTKLLIPFMNNGRPTLIHTIVPSRTAVGGNDSNLKINKGTVQQTSENSLESNAPFTESNGAPILDTSTSPTEPATVVGTQNPTLVSNQLDAGKPDVPYTTTTMPTTRFDESSPLVDKTKALEEDSTVATTPTSYSRAPTAFSVLSTSRTSSKSPSSKGSVSKDDPKTTSIVNDGMVALPTSYISQPRVDEDALSEEETTSKSYLKPKTSTIVNDISPVTESLAQTSFQSTSLDDLASVTDKTTDPASQTPTDKTMSTTIDSKSETPSIVNELSTSAPNFMDTSNLNESVTTMSYIQPVTPKIAPSNDAATIENDKSPEHGSDPLVGSDLIAENVTSTSSITTALSNDSQSAILGSKSINDELPKVNEIFVEDLKPFNSTRNKTLPGDGYIDEHGQNRIDSQSTDESAVPIKDELFESPNLVSKIPENLEKGGPTPTGAMNYPTLGTTSKKPANSGLNTEDHSQSPNLSSSSTTSNIFDPKSAALKPSSTAENSSQSKALKPSPKLSRTDTGPTSSQPDHPNATATERTTDTSLGPKPIETVEVTEPISSTESEAKIIQPTISTTTIQPTSQTLQTGDDINDLGHAIRGLHDLVNKLMSTVNAPSTANPNVVGGSLPLSESETKPIQVPKEPEDTSNSPSIISAENPGLKTDLKPTEAPPSTTETVGISGPLMDLTTEAPLSTTATIGISRPLVDLTTTEAPPSTTETVGISRPLVDLTTTEAPPSTTVTIGISQPTEANSRPDSTNDTERPTTTESTTKSADVLSSQSPKSTTVPVLEKSHDQAGLRKDSPEVVEVTNLDEIHEPRKPESTVNGPKTASDQTTTLNGDALPRNKTTKPLTENNAKNDDDSLKKNDVNGDKLSSQSPDLTNQTTLNSIPKNLKATSQSPVETLSPSPVLEEEILDSNDNPVAFTEISYDASIFTSTPTEKKKLRISPQGFHKILGFFSWMRGKKNADNSTEADATKLTETAFDPFEEIVESPKNGTPMIDKDVLPEKLANWFLGFRSGEDDDSSNSSSANESLSSEVLDSSAEFRDLYHSFLEAAIHNVNNVSAIVNASEPIGTPHSWWSSFREVEDADGETDSQSSTELEETIHNGSIVNGSTSRWRLGRWLTKLKGFRNILKSAPIENGSNATKSDEASSQSKGASVEGIRDDAHGPEEKIEKSENSGSWLSTFWGDSSPVNASSLETSSQSENTKENEAYDRKEQSEKSTGWFSRFWGTKDDRMNATSTVNGTQADDASKKDSKMADSVLAEKGLSADSTQEDLDGSSIVNNVTTNSDDEDEGDSALRIVFTEQKSKLLSLLAEMQDAHKANETQQHSDAVSERQTISTSTQPSKHSHFHSSDFEVWSDENE